MRSGIVMQNIARTVLYSDSEIEKFRKEIFEEDLKQNAPIILIQPAFIDNVIRTGNDGKDILEAMTGHELRHVVEQYILELHNTLFSVKNSLNSDFKANNIFGLKTNTEEYSKLRSLIYCLSAEEQRGRIQAVYNLCKSVITDNAFYSQMTASYNKVMGLRYYHSVKELDKNFRTEIVCALRAEPFKYVHELNLFRRILHELIFFKRNDIREMLLIVGYFLYKHKYIRSKTSGLSGRDLSEFFSFDNIKNLLNNPSRDVDDYLKIIYNFIKKDYLKYENIVYNIIGMNIEKIFHYKSPTNNQIIRYQKMAADNDLKLKDSEVGLINESFNYFSINLERWLNIEPHYC